MWLMGFPNPYELHERGGENTFLSLTIRTQNEYQKILHAPVSELLAKQNGQFSQLSLIGCAA